MEVCLAVVSKRLRTCCLHCLLKHLGWDGWEIKLATLQRPGLSNSGVYRLAPCAGGSRCGSVSPQRLPTRYLRGPKPMRTRAWGSWFYGPPHRRTNEGVGYLATLVFEALICGLHHFAWFPAF